MIFFGWCFGTRIMCGNNPHLYLNFGQGLQIWGTPLTISFQIVSSAFYVSGSRYGRCEGGFDVLVARREKEAGTDYYPGRAIQVQVQRIIQVRPAIIIQQQQPVATKPAGPMLVSPLGSKHRTNSLMWPLLILRMVFRVSQMSYR